MKSPSPSKKKPREKATVVLMAYVYEKVGGDPHSHQTPHFGFESMGNHDSQIVDAGSVN